MRAQATGGGRWPGAPEAGGGAGGPLPQSLREEPTLIKDALILDLWPPALEWGQTSCCRQLPGRGPSSQRPQGACPRLTRERFPGQEREEGSAEAHSRPGATHFSRKVSFSCSLHMFMTWRSLYTFMGSSMSPFMLMNLMRCWSAS